MTGGSGGVGSNFTSEVSDQDSGGRNTTTLVSHKGSAGRGWCSGRGVGTLKIMREVTGRGRWRAAREAACRSVESDTERDMPRAPTAEFGDRDSASGARGRSGGSWSSASAVTPAPSPGTDPDRTRGEGPCGSVGVWAAIGVAGVELACCWVGW